MKQLDIITNTIIANLGNTESKGLVNGKMGLCLFLYEYAKSNGNAWHEELAERLIYDIYTCDLQSLSTDIKCGYTGIGVGLCMLISKKLAKGSPDKVLKQIDHIILDNIEYISINDLRYNNHYFSSGIYLLHRMPLASDEQRKKWCTNFIDTLRSIDNKYLYTNNRSSYSLFCKSVLTILEEIDRYNIVNKNDLDFLKRRYISDDTQTIFGDNMDQLSDKLWFHYLHKKSFSTSKKETEEYIRNKISQYPYIIDTINNELAIIGLYLLN